MYSFFYSRKDIAFARLIRESLQENEIDTWIDWERIPVGEKWWPEICSAIENANVFMFIISKNSIGSPVCKDEIDQALKNHKRIIPIVVDDLKPAGVYAAPTGGVGCSPHRFGDGYCLGDPGLDAAQSGGVRGGPACHCAC
jgi:hypothetical protein